MSRGVAQIDNREEEETTGAQTLLLCDFSLCPRAGRELDSAGTPEHCSTVEPPGVQSQGVHVLQGVWGLEEDGPVSETGQSSFFCLFCVTSSIWA